MAHTITQHLIRQKIAYILFLALAGMSIGVYVSFFSHVETQAAVSALAVVDSDTGASAGFGIDGRDFSLSWTVTGSAPEGFQGYEVFILPFGVIESAATSTIKTTACGGGPCQSLGFFPEYLQSAFILPPFYQADSAGTAWSGGTSYKAALLINNSTSALAELVTSTAALTPTADAPSDNTAPFFDHLSVHTAIGATDAVFHAFVSDDQTTAAAFANTSDGGNESLSLVYGIDVSVASSTVSGVQVAGNLFKFTIPGASIPASGNTFEYFLIARDGLNNVRVFCTDPTAVSVGTCLTSPFVVNTIAAGSRTIAGVINSDGSPLQDAYVFAAGFAGPAVQTNASGVYTLPSGANLPNNSAFDVVAYKNNFCQNTFFVNIQSSNITEKNFNLNPGQCGGQGGAGGGSGNFGSPHVVESFPGDGANNVPVDQPIFAFLDQTMNASTINDFSAIDAGDKVYLSYFSGDSEQKVPGQVSFCGSSASAGCSALSEGQTNAILFDPTNNLATTTFYTLVITEGVTSQSGQSIQGNRQGGGQTIGFFTVGNTFSEGSFTFGGGGQFMPPFVQSMNPAPGFNAAPNTNILLEFNEPMDTTSITDSTILLKTSAGASVAKSVSLDSISKRFVTLNPTSNLSAGTEYTVEVLGTVKNNTGIALLPPGSAGNGFKSFFQVAGDPDSAAPTIYPMIDAGSTGVAVNTIFELGFNEQVDASTINASNITMKRGSTSVAIDVEYNPSANSVFVVPNDVLGPNTAYTITFSTSVTDLAGIPLSSSQAYSYTTGSTDTTAPKLVEARCDDWSCFIRFTESMNHKTQVDGNTLFGASVLNHANITLVTDAADLVGANAIVSWDGKENALDIEGLNLSGSIGQNFTLTIETAATDLSGNAIVSAGSANVKIAKVENSAQTFGDFGGGGMFGPPKAEFVGGSLGGAEFKPQGFGNFTTDQFAFGTADMAFPFNQMAGQDVNVFQVRFSPGVALQNNDQIEVTFPSGTNITNIIEDIYSPFKDDLNEFASGTVAISATSTDATARKFTLTLSVTPGGTGANDQYTIDLRKIINPSVPKDPSTGGYTVGIKAIRGGVSLASKTSMPYFIMAGGSNSITVDVCVTNCNDATAGASGLVALFGGGPSGPINKLLTMTNGQLSQVDGSAGTTIALSEVPDGCYFFGTDPFITLGASDYFGQMAPEPVCVFGGQSQTKNILLTASSGSNAASVIVKLVDGDGAPFNFNGSDLDIFAGGPGQFVVKTLEGLNAADSNGYTLKLPANGTWFVGVGPAMPKNSSQSKPKSLAGTPPPPTDIMVSGVGGTPAVTSGAFLPPNVSFNDGTDTITFTFESANKTITGKVKNGDGESQNLQNVEVFVHQQGFGVPTFTKTDDTGVFSLSVSKYGSYEVGIFKDGLSPIFKQIEVKADGADADSNPDVYYEGKLTTGTSGANPFILKVKKPDYSISGKILDSNGNGIEYAPVFAVNQDTGEFIPGQSGQGGNYTVFIDAGTWVVNSQLPPDKSDTCGTFSKTVTITSESKSTQNISPSTSVCYTLSGAITIDDATKANVPVSIEGWNTITNKPTGTFFKGTSTNSSGVYTAKVPSGTYRISTWSPNYGEVYTTVSNLSADKADAHITSSLETITFSFTGALPAMSAFVEVKQTSDKNVRIGKQASDLTSDVTVSVPAGDYTYFVDVQGYGKFTDVVPNSNAVSIDVSTSDFIAIAGNINDASNNDLAGALVTLTDTTTGLTKTAVADEDGDYLIGVKAGTYEVQSSLAKYVPGEAAQTVTFTTNTVNYDFGGASPDQDALVESDSVITGTVLASGGSAVSEGFVWAENAAGIVIKAEINPTDGTYDIPVTEGTWTVKGVAPLHTETQDSATVTISGASDDQSAGNLQLTADATNIPASATGSVAANTGGSIDDTDDTGLKLTVGAGVLESGNSNVTVNLEKNFTAPDTETFDALSNASFEITATGNSSIKTLSGNAEIQLDYSDYVSDLPAGVSESELQLMYYSPERGEYVPVEGGFTVDPTNNIISGQIDHFTTFVVAYVPPAQSNPETPSPSPSTGGGGTTATPPTLPKVAKVTEKATKIETMEVEKPEQIMVGASDHTVTVSKASDKEATLTVQSDPVILTLKKGESKTVDTDTDSVVDLLVLYNGLADGGGASFSFTNLTDAGELSNAVAIHSGSYETVGRDVVLSFNVPTAKQIAMSNSKSFKDASYVNYTPTTTWKLTEGNGKKTVYVTFKSSSGGTVVSSDGITLVGQTSEQKPEPVEETKGGTILPACDLTIGGAYKEFDAPGVYYITDSCTKRPFKNPDIFFSYFDSWDKVKVVSAKKLSAVPNDVIAFMPWGPQYKPKDGALAKVVTDPNVYLLFSGQRHLIVSEGVFTALKFGWGWIEDVAQSVLDKFSLGDAISDTGHHPNATLITYPNSSKVYRLEADPKDASKQVKRPVKNEAVFDKNGFNWEKIITIDASETYPDGAEIK